MLTLLPNAGKYRIWKNIVSTFPRCVRERFAVLRPGVVRSRDLSPGHRLLLPFPLARLPSFALPRAARLGDRGTETEPSPSRAPDSARNSPQPCARRYGALRPARRARRAADGAPAGGAEAASPRAAAGSGRRADPGREAVTADAGLWGAAVSAGHSTTRPGQGRVGQGRARPPASGGGEGAATCPRRGGPPSCYLGERCGPGRTVAVL